MMETIQSVAIYVLGLIAVILVARILSKPIKIILRLLFNTLIGGIVLVLLNTLGGAWGLSIGVNPITCVVTGILGVPGIILLLVLKFIFGG